MLLNRAGRARHLHISQWGTHRGLACMNRISGIDETRTVHTTLPIHVGVLEPQEDQQRCRVAADRASHDARWRQSCCRRARTTPGATPS